MTTLVFTVATSDDLEQLARQPRRSFAVHLAMPCLSIRERTQWEETLNTLARECGCSLGGGTALTGIAVSLGAEFAHGPPRLAALGPLTARVLVVAVALGGLGKTLGVIRARRQFRAACAQLRNQIALKSAT